MKAVEKGIAIEALAALVSETLEQAGIKATLSGGSAVSLYSRNRYQSLDLDFVSDDARKDIEKTLLPLGFKPRQRYLYHQNTDYFLEFPAGPLAVGNEIIREPTYLKTPYGLVRIISATQCVMDRLAAYYHWDDRQSLDQAVLVAKEQDAIDFDSLEVWSEREGEMEKYRAFLTEVF